MEMYLKAVRFCSITEKCLKDGKHSSRMKIVTQEWKAFLKEENFLKDVAQGWKV
jgi:hypothetical protein